MSTPPFFVPGGYQPPPTDQTTGPAPVPVTQTADPAHATVPAPLPPTAAPPQPAPFTPPTAAPLAHPATPGTVGQPQPAQVSAYHANVQRSGFDDDVKTGDYDSYKGQKGRTDRIGFLAPRDIVWGRTHFIEANNTKGFYICDSTFQKQGGQEVPLRLGACCQKFGPPKKRFAALIVQYNTDQTGRVLQPFSFSLKVWRINEVLYDQLRTLNREHPLEQVDIWAKCTDDQFWKYEITPLRESFIHNPQVRSSADPSGSGQTIGQIVDAYIAAMQPRLDRTTGKVNTPQEWAELLGHAATGGFGPPAGGFVPGPQEQVVDNIAQLLGGSAPPR